MSQRSATPTGLPARGDQAVSGKQMMAQPSDRRPRIAFVKFGGLSAGGTERWLQMMAANLPELFEVDYYYCDAAPYIGSDYRHADTDPARLRYMQASGVSLIKFTVGAKDITTPTHDWVDTTFWEVFEESKYDLVQTARAGHAEYPFHLLRLPIVEYVTLNAGVDKSPNIVCTVHLSQWQRAQWYRSGGDLSKSAVIPIPAEPAVTTLDLRAELRIPAEAIVAGFHQRADEHIFSPIPLQAFAMIGKPERCFVIMGGAKAYRDQAKALGLRNVHFVEHSGDARRISSFLNTLDIFAHGRRDGETFGTVLAEALMHGKPCLSHRSEGANAQPETMGPAGLFAANVSEYALHLRRLFAEPDFRAGLASKAKAHAEANYSVRACVNGLEQIYRRLLGLPNLGVPEKRIEYGQSDLGFLYAGDLCSPASLGYHVMTGGIPEEFDVHIVRFFLSQVRCFLDIGANTGLYGFVVAKHGREDAIVHMFEPQADCCEVMAKTVWLNNWERKVSIHPIAIGSKRGRQELHLSGTGSTLDNSFNDNKTLLKEWVRVETLDKFVVTAKLTKVDFVKIDVEGSEQDVLEGARDVIERDHPVLFVEIADRVRGRQFRNPNYGKTLSWLRDAGYKVFRSTESLRLEEITSGDGYEHLAMYLCLHGETHGAMELDLHEWARQFVRRKARERRRRRMKLAARILRNPFWAASRAWARVRHSSAVKRK